MATAAQEELQEWHYKATDCCSPFKTSLLAWFFPCIIYGRVKHRMRHNGSLEGYKATEASIDALDEVCVAPWQQRTEMREKYHLKGNLTSDILWGCIGDPCMLVQHEKEVVFREKALSEKQEQYKAEAPMEYPGKQEPAQE